MATTTANKEVLKAMKAINEKLKAASKAYYAEDDEIMSNYEYDALMDQLGALEAQYGVLLPDSMTQHVGYEVVSKLKKVRHEDKALSLDKTKDRQGLADWLGDQNGCISWKMDGLTVILCYKGGQLIQAVTRGNGDIGEDVTHNAKHIAGIPHTIPFTGDLVLRGEAVMTYSRFNAVNAALPADQQYKNPRNLASGTLRSLDAKDVATRGLNFFAFELVKTSQGLPSNSFSDCLDWLATQGFNVVEHYRVTKDQVVPAIEFFENKITSNDFPSDGLVLQIDDIAYGKSLGTTGKFPRSGKAFKWADETAETTIRKIIWQPSRTGLINPVAEFDEVELEGTTVKRATCCNISFMEEKGIRENAKALIYKANMIIPTILKVTANGGMPTIPSVCPVCGGATEVRQDGQSKMLYCTNPNCAAKQLKAFAHYVKRDAMNIEGISESTLEALMSNGLLTRFADIYEIKNHPEIATWDNFGKASFKKMCDAIEKSRKSSLAQYLYSWGIPLVGRHASSDISDKCSGDWKTFVDAMDAGYDWSDIEGIGEALNTKLHEWWKTGNNRANFIELPLNNVLDLSSTQQVIQTPTKGATTGGQATGPNNIAGKTFCITGAVYKFTNRNEAGAYIAQHGGKLASSVSKNTNYLVTNDTTSGSNKNKKAAELGVAIITEDELIEMGGGM